MRRILPLLLFVMLALMPALARADDASAALAAIASGNLDSMRQGIADLAASGDPRAIPILESLKNSTLFMNDDNVLFIQNANGSFVNAATGAPAPGLTADALTQVFPDLRAQAVIDKVLGQLQLFSPDAATRENAAEALFQSHDVAALPILSKALSNETDPAVRTRLEQAHAAALLFSKDAPVQQQLAAVAVLRARGDLDARALLASLSNQPPDVAAATRAAVAAIDRSLQLWGILQNVYYGIGLGSVLLLAAAGLAITFGVMGVINMAHGEMVMLGAYTTYVVQQAMHQIAPAWYQANLLFAVPLAFLVTGLIGIAIERSLIRWLYGRPLETLLATWGLSLVLQQAVRSIFNSQNKDVDTPLWMSGDLHLAGLTITLNRLYIIGFTVVVLFALMAALRYTPLGLRMRAVTQNRLMAAAMGIRTPWIDALTFGLGSGVAGIAGVALSQIDNVSPNLGQNYIIDSFLVVVFGGVGNLWGTAVGALTLGVINKFLEPVAGAVLGKIVVLVLVILFIQRRPRGMFPLKGRAAEA
ncbi:MAG TPA: urea ABC transporter permease subunit UrtB [Acetobacteraceae bacterium]|nr:urea ABC transporter permease subunit UrtB [Acetobacteraceae bacterium]